MTNDARLNEYDAGLAQGRLECEGEIESLKAELIKLHGEMGGMVDGASYVSLKAERDRFQAKCAEGAAVLKYIIERYGPWHDEECPEDDTCGCSAKPLHDRVNAICSGNPGQAPPKYAFPESGEVNPVGTADRLAKLERVLRRTGVFVASFHEWMHKQGEPLDAVFAETAIVRDGIQEALAVAKEGKRQ